MVEDNKGRLLRELWKSIKKYDWPDFWAQIYLCLLVMSLFVHWIGIHNLDWCQNLNAINADILYYYNDAGYSEQTIGGTVWDVDTCYIDGLKKVIYAPLVAVFMAFYLGLNWRQKR